MAINIQGPRVNVPVPTDAPLPAAVQTERAQTQTQTSDSVSRDQRTQTKPDEKRGDQNVKTNADLGPILARAAGMALGSANAAMIGQFVVDLGSLLSAAPGMPFEPHEMSGLMRLQTAISDHPELEGSALQKAVGELADLTTSFLTDGAHATLQGKTLSKDAARIVAAFKRADDKQATNKEIAALAKQIVARQETAQRQTATTTNTTLPADVAVLVQALTGRARSAIPASASKSDETKADGAKGKEVKGEKKEGAKKGEKSEGMRQTSSAQEQEETYGVKELEPIVRRTMPRDMSGFIDAALASGDDELIMMAIISDNRADLKDALAEMQEINKQKKARREFITRMKEQRAQLDKQLHDRYDQEVKEGRIDASKTSFEDFEKTQSFTIMSSNGAMLPAGNSRTLPVDSEFQFSLDDDTLASKGSNDVDSTDPVDEQQQTGLDPSNPSPPPAGDPGGLTPEQFATYASRLHVTPETLAAARAFYFSIPQNQRAQLGMDDSFEAWLIDKPPSGLGAKVPATADQDATVKAAFGAEVGRVTTAIGENNQAGSLYALPPAAIQELREAWNDLPSAQRPDFLVWLQSAGMKPQGTPGENNAQALSTLLNGPAVQQTTAQRYNLTQADFDALKAIYDSQHSQSMKHHAVMGLSAWLASPRPNGPGLVRNGHNNDNLCVDFYAHVTSDVHAPAAARSAAAAQLAAYHQHIPITQQDRAIRAGQNQTRIANEQAAKAAADQHAADAKERAEQRDERRHTALNDRAATAKDLLLAPKSGSDALSQDEIAHYAEQLGVSGDTVMKMRQMYNGLPPEARSALGMGDSFESWVVKAAPEGFGATVPPAPGQAAAIDAALQAQQKRISDYAVNQGIRMGQDAPIAAMYQLPMVLVEQLHTAFDRLPDAEKAQGFAAYCATLRLIPMSGHPSKSQQAVGLATNLGLVSGAIAKLNTEHPPAHDDAATKASADAARAQLIGGSEQPQPATNTEQRESMRMSASSPSGGGALRESVDGSGQHLSVEEFDARIQGYKDGLDSMSEATEEMQLRLQMYMDRLNKAMEMLSNMMKKKSDTAGNIIKNF